MYKVKVVYFTSMLPLSFSLSEFEMRKEKENLTLP